MKLGVYVQASSSLGGALSVAAIIADVARATHEVELIHHRAGTTAAELAAFTGVDLHDVPLRAVPEAPYAFGERRLPWRRFAEARAWQAELSRPYDIFVNLTHLPPPFCHARLGVLIVLFPVGTAPWHAAKADHDSSWAWRRVKADYHRWEWQMRFRSYAHRLCISDFTRRWTWRRWNVDACVLYPPVETRVTPSTDKDDVVLSVGRFTTSGNAKKQCELMRAFRDLRASGVARWRYVSVGATGEEPGDREFFREVCRLAANVGVEVVADVSRAELDRLYARAKVFWHGTGWGEDEARAPERAEHFGIVTVEAMAAGCVPVVLDCGAQAEIVEHGVSGFLWRTPAELQRYTAALVGDPGLRERMACAARARASMFGREQFARRFLDLLEHEGTAAEPEPRLCSA